MLPSGPMPAGYGCNLSIVIERELASWGVDGKGGAHPLLHMRVLAHLHVPFLAEIGLALHDVAANQLLGILCCLRYPGGCIAYQDASASLHAKFLQTIITHLVAGQILQHTFYGESSSHLVFGMTTDVHVIYVDSSGKGRQLLINLYAGLQEHEGCLPAGETTQITFTAGKFLVNLVM